MAVVVQPLLLLLLLALVLLHYGCLAVAVVVKYFVFWS
jgi:hypothetical protein